MNRLEKFLRELHYPEKIILPQFRNTSNFVEATAIRRASRKKLLRSYWLLKTESPNEAAKLTRKNLEMFIQKFTVQSDNILTKRPMIESYYVLNEIKKGRFINISFRDREAEKMVCLAADLKWHDKALALMNEFILNKNRPLNISAYDAILQSLAESNNVEEMEFWFNRIKSDDMEMTDKTIRAMVIGYMGVNKVDVATNLLRSDYKGKSEKLIKWSREFANDNQMLLEASLNYFVTQAIAEKRFHLGRTIYILKLQNGMSGNKLIKKLISRSIHKKEFRTAEILLETAIEMNDTRGSQLCAEYLINHYLSRSNIKLSLDVWDMLTKSGIDLQKETMDELLISCSKARYQSDVLRLYKSRKKLYPEPSFEVQVYATRCMVFSKELNIACSFAKNMVESLPLMDRPLAELAGRTLFALCAKSGNIELFESVFKQTEALGLDLRHKALTSLAACYLQKNNTSSAKIAFKNVVEHTEGPDVVDFNILMRTVIIEDKELNHEKILEILKHMSLVNIMPDETTLRTMLKYYDLESKMLPEIYKKLLEMPLRGSDVVFLNNIALTKLLTKYDINNVAGRFLENNKGLILPHQEGKAIERNAMTYNILINESLKNFSNSALSERLFKDMLSRSIKPSRSLYESFIQSLCQQEKVIKARRYVESMEENIGVKPNQKTYTKIADALIRMGKREEARLVLLNEIDPSLMDRQMRRRLKGKWPFNR